MAVNDVVSHNATTKRLEVPQAGDTYNMPREVKAVSIRFPDNSLLVSANGAQGPAGATGPQGPAAPAPAAADVPNAPAGNIIATDVQAALNELDVEKEALANKGAVSGYPSLDVNGEVIELPAGAAAEVAAGAGGNVKKADGTWGTAGGGGATGGGVDAVFYENDQVVSTNYTLTAGKHAHSQGPISIATGVVVTVPTGATWGIS